MYSQPCGASQPELCEVLRSVQCAEVSIEGLTKAATVCCFLILHKIPTQTSVTSIKLILTLLLEINNSQWFQFKQTYIAVQVFHLINLFIYGKLTLRDHFSVSQTWTTNILAHLKSDVHHIENNTDINNDFCPIYTFTWESLTI